MTPTAPATQKLSDLKPSQSGVIQDYVSQDETTERLREMGLVKGTRIEVRRLAPLGDPMELTVRGYRLSIRREDAARIIVDSVQGESGS